MRSCNNCGSEYQDTDSTVTCKGVVFGGRCGGQILPPPSETPRTQACLICLDKGTVKLADNTERPCPRGCKI